MREWLREIRLKKQLSQEETANLLGLTQSEYSRIERKERWKALPLPLAIKISSTFLIDLGEISKLEGI